MVSSSFWVRVCAIGENMAQTPITHGKNPLTFIPDLLFMAADGDRRFNQSLKGDLYADACISPTEGRGGARIYLQ